MLRHTYNNGLVFDVPMAFGKAIHRARKYINLHEPFEESVFDHVLKNSQVNHFIDLGSAWGYYSILVKKRSPNTNVVGVDPNPDLIKISNSNQKLNNVQGISFIKGKVDHQPRTLKLINLIKDFKGSTLIKIDIQGGAHDALSTACDHIFKFKNIIIGTHGSEHERCLDLLSQKGFNIKLDYIADKIPIQPDGLIWATYENS